MITENSIATHASHGNVFRELTPEETEQVSGGNPIGAAVGAVSGAAGYLGGASTTGEFTWKGLAFSTGSGAIAGGTGGASALAAYVVPRVSFFGGAIVGRADES